MKLFSVRDVKADSFGAPMSMATRGLAKRSFGDACMSKDSELNRYPSDYSLYELAEYEPNSGTIIPHPTPVYIQSAAEAISDARLQYEKNQLVLPGVEVSK